MLDEPEGAEEKRLIPRTDDPRLFWLDEIFDTPSERAARDREKAANQEKWAKLILDEEGELGPAEEQTKIYGLAPEILLIVGSVPVLLALLSQAVAG